MRRKNMWVVAICILIAISLFSLFKYTYDNEFNVKLLEFLGPILGAIIVSIFLIHNWISNQTDESTQKFNGVISLITDMETGIIYSGAERVNRFKSDYLYVDGLVRISEFSTDIDVLKSLGVEDCKNLSMSQRLNLLEYTIFDWFQRNNKIQNSWLNEVVVFTGYTNRVETAKPKMDIKTEIDVVKIDDTVGSNNPILKSKPLNINFPPGTKVSIHSLPKEHFGSNGETIKINTDHSEINIYIAGTSAGRINENNFPQIKEFLPNVSQNLWVSYYAVNMTQTFKKWRYFSELRKLNSEWFEYIGFSFEKLFFNPPKNSN